MLTLFAFSDILEDVDKGSTFNLFVRNAEAERIKAANSYLVFNAKHCAAASVISLVVGISLVSFFFFVFVSANNKKASN